MSSVHINGSAIRTFREGKGLTQLYLATVVGVTTDTISRWENRKYPSIKLENAEKLALALEVELEQLLDKQEQHEPTNTETGAKVVAFSSREQGEREEKFHAPPLHAKQRTEPFSLFFRKFRRISWFLVPFLLLILLLLWLNLTSEDTASASITVTRTVPPHTAPNLRFPVIIKVQGQVGQQTPILLREEVLGQAVAESLTGSSRNHQFATSPRWVGTLDNGKTAFLYMVTPHPDIEMGDIIRFSGQCIAGDMKGRGEDIKGQTISTIAPYHWADTDRDNTITDNEILKAYEQYTIPESVGFNFSEVETLWLAGQYSWDENTQTFQPQSEQNKESP
ncbi:MAG: hypothetical protein CSA33_06880 [Desulfobulbus propionicus]|nr:MAG: hypothetical protein CSA33_06880 [Desulfobulbus propionicus]